MAKVLITAHLGRHFRIFGHYDYKVLLDLGHEVHIAANFNDALDNFNDTNVIKHQIDFSRNPYSKENLVAYRQLKNLLDENYYDLIHTQSPSGGAVTRLAARGTRKKGTKILYTAHGFHFFKGASKRNWIIYFTIEKILSMYTDSIITINDEDFKNANSKLNAKSVKYIHGVGIDLERFEPQSQEKKNALRLENNFNSNDYIFIYVGELSYRKQQDLIIKAASKVKKNLPNLKILFVGTGGLEEEYKENVKKMNLENNVIFLGYRNDVPKLMALSDVGISASRQEGLPLNIMEAMATGLPLIVTNSRGNRDLVTQNENGLIVGLSDSVEMAKAINTLYNDKNLALDFKKSNLEKVKLYSIEKVSKEMKDIYEEVLNNI